MQGNEAMLLGAAQSPAVTCTKCLDGRAKSLRICLALLKRGAPFLCPQGILEKLSRVPRAQKVPRALQPIENGPKHRLQYTICKIICWPRAERVLI